MRLGLKTGPLCHMFSSKLKEPCSFSKVPDGPYTYFPNILRVQKRRNPGMYEWVRPRPPTHTKCGLRFPPQYRISYRCLLKVLCPVSRPIATLDCVLLKDNNLALVARSGPEINSLACLCVLQGPRRNSRCCFSIQRFIFLLIFCLETPKKDSGPKNRWTELSLARLSAISFPRTPACPRIQYSPSACRVEIKFNAFWHCRTKGDVVLAASTYSI
jgi:hypothetical protein